MNGRSITVAGATVPGGVNIVSTVTRVAQAEPTLFRLNPGATVTQAINAAGRHKGDPNYLRPYGAIVFDANANRGTSSVQTTLAPGRYVALNTESNNPQRWPRVNFTVSRNPAPTSLPRPNATVAAIDFNFRSPSTLRTGQLTRLRTTASSSIWSSGSRSTCWPAS
ncbi:MAG: hypothetical protein JO153_20565 [Solirubrobacterales bacterium]|nr:hypothetical protein [Solirubrobacterales bacterium]